MITMRLACTALALSAFSGADAVEISFAPEEETSLTRTFVADSEYELTAISISINGEEQEGLGEIPSMEISHSERIVVSDVIDEMGDGQPARLTRTYDELSAQTVFSSEAAEEDFETNQVSDLTGQTVTVAWDEDEEEYTFEAEDEEVDEELLEGLVEDMDLRLFLPDDEVEEEDSWDVPVEAYLGLMWPGGLVGFRAEEEDEPSQLELEIAEGLIDSLSGSGTATLMELREEDGVTLAVISVELEADAEAEVEDEDAEATISLESHRELTGELLWNLDTGHLASATFDAEASRLRTITSAFTPEGHEALEIVREEEFTGTVHYEVTVE